MRTSSLNQSRAVYEEKNTFHSKSGHVSLIRKELVTLAGSHTHAVILNQLLYWTQRTKDFSLMLEEEKNRGIATTEGFPREEFPQEEPPQYGWIYKTASDLIEETMLHVDRTTLRRYLKFLVKQKWLFERSNPQNKWNKTIQYRVNVQKIQEDLMALGLNLSEIPGLEKVNFKGMKEGNRSKKHSNVYLLPLKSRIASSDGQPAHTNEQNARSDGHNARSSGQIAHSKTENTTEITNREHAEGARANSDKSFFGEVLEIWNACVSQEGLPPANLTDERQRRIYSLFPLYFESDLTQWKQFCNRIACSPFLMGQGPRKWRVSLDWILVEENLIKVLEGNFDDPEEVDKKQTATSNTERVKEISTTLASIEDPMWREWCSQLDFESRNAVSLGELKSIANARFLEVEGDRLIWIGSSDPQVLSRIENLRLKLLPLTQKTFPKVRNLRTRLCEDHSVLQKETPQQLGELS
ncbi:MAG: hypothetical protein K2Y08_03535 [Alphaproteobacteria bacterium]|nr:hypothetical protein [Alphaproteobacteria bacterium]